MGQKVNPVGFRVAVYKDWRSRWFAMGEEFGKLLQEDIKIRRHIKRKLSYAGIPKVLIERKAQQVKITLSAARPGLVIGRRGSEIDRLRDELTDLVGKEIAIEVEEVRSPEKNAQLVADNIALQLRKRISFRRAMKRAIASAMESGAGGIKVSVAGRLGGSEMSRRIMHKDGKIPLQTLRADIDYGFAESRTTSGVIGVKVWVYQGEREPVLHEVETPQGR